MLGTESYHTKAPLMQNRNYIVWILVIGMILAMAIMSQGNSNGAGAKDATFTQLEAMVDNGEVKEISIEGDIYRAVKADGTKVRVVGPYEVMGTGIRDDFQSKGIVVNYQEEASNFIGNLLMSIFPILLLVGLYVFFMRNMQGGGGRGGAMGFGKSRAKMLTEESGGRKLFDDVAGVEEAKQDLQEVVEFLQDPTKFQRLGAKIPKGALLIGPPGTGKTLLARAVAGEAGVPFFTISGSDFVEMFVGVGASRVRDMFEQAKKNAPCIIFIDEIDAVGRHRGVGTSGGHEEREQTLNQLLVEMDGFDGTAGIILIAATNRPDVLDKALLRPGRFDRQIEVPLPDIMGREKILDVHMREVPTSKDVDSQVIARGTPGFSGADLANLVNEAALLAARRNKRKVGAREFDDARDKVLMGAERRTLSMTLEEKANTAYHEAGHAIVGLNMPGSMPIHKATIIPRGRALGMVQYLPERDQISQSRKEMIASMAMAMGGRAAEELKFGYDNVTSGASSDIEQVTRIATAMVTEWGLSDEIGPIAYNHKDQNSFVPGIGRGSSISPETASKIENEIKRLITEAHETALAILKKKKKQWHALAEALLEFETLTGEEIKDLMDGIQPKRTPKDSKPTLSAIPKTPKPKKGLSGKPTPAT